MHDYDANGNLVVRRKGVSGQEQALRWDANNRLAPGGEQRRHIAAK